MMSKAKPMFCSTPLRGLLVVGGLAACSTSAVKMVHEQDDGRQAKVTSSTPSPSSSGIATSADSTKSSASTSSGSLLHDHDQHQASHTALLRRRRHSKSSTASTSASTCTATSPASSGSSAPSTPYWCVGVPSSPPFVRDSFPFLEDLLERAGEEDGGPCFVLPEMNSDSHALDHLEPLPPPALLGRAAKEKEEDEDNHNGNGISSRGGLSSLTCCWRREDHPPAAVSASRAFSGSPVEVCSSSSVAEFWQPCFADVSLLSKGNLFDETAATEGSNPALRRPRQTDEKAENKSGQEQDCEGVYRGRSPACVFAPNHAVLDDDENEMTARNFPPASEDDAWKLVEIFDQYGSRQWSGSSEEEAPMEMVCYICHTLFGDHAEGSAQESGSGPQADEAQETTTPSTFSSDAARSGSSPSRRSLFDAGTRAKLRSLCHLFTVLGQIPMNFSVLYMVLLYGTEWDLLRLSRRKYLQEFHLSYVRACYWSLFEVLPVLTGAATEAAEEQEDYLDLQRKVLTLPSRVARRAVRAAREGAKERKRVSRTSCSEGEGPLPGSCWEAIVAESVFVARDVTVTLAKETGAEVESLLAQVGRKGQKLAAHVKEVRNRVAAFIADVEETGGLVIQEMDNELSRSTDHSTEGGAGPSAGAPRRTTTDSCSPPFPTTTPTTTATSTRSSSLVYRAVESALGSRAPASSGSRGPQREKVVVKERLSLLARPCKCRQNVHPACLNGWLAHRGGGTSCSTCQAALKPRLLREIQKRHHELQKRQQEVLLGQQQDNREDLDEEDEDAQNIKVKDCTSSEQELLQQHIDLVLALLRKADSALAAALDRAVDEGTVRDLAQFLHDVAQPLRDCSVLAATLDRCHCLLWRPCRDYFRFNWHDRMHPVGGSPPVPPAHGLNPRYYLSYGANVAIGKVSALVFGLRAWRALVRCGGFWNGFLRMVALIAQTEVLNVMAGILLADWIGQPREEVASVNCTNTTKVAHRTHPDCLL